MIPPGISDRRPTVAIETHGCKLNQSDSGVLAVEFRAAGFDVVHEDQPVDVYVMNSCTVTHVADRKARQSLYTARRRNPNATVVATGCYAERDPHALRRLEGVDLVLGNTDKPSLVRQIMDWRGDTALPCATGTDALPVSPAMLRTRAMVKIQEGCNQVCAYCIVPKVRGRERSIPPDQLINQINEHVSLGYREVVLTGTQLSSYGFDLSEIDLPALLRRILHEGNMVRLRVSSLQAHEITSDLLDVWRDSRLCPHFHLALQSGSDPVLARMRRRYDSRQYEQAVAMIRDAVPDASITTDVIVGFPGETDEQFEDTHALCERIGFSAMHVFPFSPRPGTSAAHFRDTVPKEVQAKRVRRLLDVARRSGETYRRGIVGAVRPVLWETRKDLFGIQHWVGLTDTYIRVAAPTLESLGNRITMALLQETNEDTVIARVLD